MGIRQRHAVPSPNATQRVLEPTGHVRMAYVEPTELPRWLATSGISPLAIISFGSPISGAFPCPIVRLDLRQLDGPRQCEVWNTDQSVRFYTDGNFSAAMSGDILFGSIFLNEEPHGGLDRTTEMAYRDLLRQVRILGFPHLWRTWNYFSRINEEQHGLERYRRFCVGRYEALAKALPDFPSSLPAGTAVGTRSGPLQIYFLAATYSAVHLGNPRQVDAYHYPSTYAPRSPSFARATFCRSDAATQLFISGTASVVGHESQHRGQVEMQARETVTNLRALIDRAECFRAYTEAESKPQSIFKVYVRNPDHLGIVRRALQDPMLLSSRLIYLQGDLCRKELLVEIEGLVTTD
jgi:chorismate lyase / 3-hydroxybenzoate synthase